MPGPFDEYIQQGYKPPQQVRPSGMGGASESIMHFASQFLQGASQARAQKFAESEKQRAGNIAALQYMMSLAKQQGLAPAALQSFEAKVMERYANEIANTKDDGGSGDGKKGNPFFGMIKGMATNLLGGNVQKVKPLSPEDIGGYFKEMRGLPKLADIQKQSSALMTEAMTEVQGRTQGMYTQRDLLSHPKFMEGLNLAETNGIEPPPMVRMALGSAMTQDQIDMHKGMSGFESAFGGGPTPAQQPPAGQQQPPMQVAGLQSQVTIPGAPAGLPAFPTMPGFNQNDEPSEVATITPELGPSPDVTVKTDLGAFPPVPAPPVAPQQGAPAPALQRVATAAGQEQVPGILGPKVEITPFMQAALQKRGVKPNNYFLHNPTTGDYMEVADYGPGRVLKVGTNERVNTDVAAQQGYRTRQAMPDSAINNTPEAVTRARTGTSAIIEQSSYDEGRKARLRALASAAYASGEPKEANNVVTAQMNRFDAEDQRKQADKAAMAMKSAMIQATQGNRAFQHTSGLRSDAEKVIKATVWDKTLDFVDQANAAYDDLKANPNKEVQGYHDLTLSRAAAHMTDPTTGIRDAEQAVFNAAQGWIKKWQTQLNPDGTLKTGQILSQQARDEIKNLVEKLGDKARRRVVGAITPVINDAERNNLPLDAIIRPDFIDAYKKMKAEPKAPSAGSGTNNNPFPKPKGF